ncbi:MAG: hypothetical protein Fur003_4730 [Candidatus Dojkabacteria bacterium]
MEQRKTNKKRLTGKVLSAKMTKTVRVEIETPKVHPVYKKTLKLRKVIMAHDETGAVEGDIVTITESRPYSKNVKWEVVKRNDTETK